MSVHVEIAFARRELIGHVWSSLAAFGKHYLASLRESALWLVTHNHC